MRARIIAVVLLTAAPLAAADAAGAAAGRVSSLVRFSSCADLTDFARERLVTTGGTTGVPFRGDVVAPATLRPPGFMPSSRTSGDGPVAMPMPAAAPESAATSDTAFSTTNVQEAGVDEPDLVKTDGKVLYVVTGGVLRVFDVTGPAPRALAQLRLDAGASQLLLRGERLLVLGTQAGAIPAPMPRPEGPVATTATSPVAPGGATKVVLTEVDVSTPSAPKVARTMELAGILAGARLTGGVVRVIVASSPAPIVADDPAALEEEAADATVARFVPRTTIRSRISRRTFRRSVVPCRRVRHPRAFSGLDLLSVLTIDLDKGLFDVDRDAVMAGAQDVYASTTSLVVASRRYAAAGDLGVAPSGGTTELHVFDAGAEARTTYRGSGSVPGFVLNQFAISEHEGAFRVATTEEAPFGPQGPAGQSESGVSVLKLVGGRLVQAGRVTGLGKGERIYAVRLLGDRGYVVTFRQVDPLYTLDLRDPAAPKVTGELKVAGYSAYLHPVSDRLLLGVGQDATEEGRRLGPQVSLFDVGDPAAPRLVGRAAIAGQGQAGAEQDHHAFLWWAPANLAIVPVDTYGDESFSGAIGFRAGTGGVGEVGRITHPRPAEDRMTPPIGRSVVVGDRVLTLSATGIGVNALADLAPLSFTPLG